MGASRLLSPIPRARLLLARLTFVPCFVAGLLCSCLPSPLLADDPIDFTSQVRPLLSDRCFHCHGPDAQNQDSEFRADSRENLFADLGGYFAVVPGDLAASELHLRIRSEDPAEQMPPPDSNRALSAAEKDILDKWIAQGAPYEGHWAFQVPQRPQPPAIANAPDLQPIDAFIRRRLLDAQLSPSPPADPATLLRRAALTLTGLLPPRDLQDRFLQNPSEQAYRAAVDELLDSMAYAERQSLRWLDASRYADTDGYQNDSERTNWPWRDWVTQAFHDNMPFDQFTIEQLAGDMLPEATVEQQLATAFSRNHRQNAEGGALAAEFFVENVIDRVETTSTVWLGLTLGCARCHDHKYDPLSQREFYQFFGYFNNIGESGFGRGVQANPTMKVASPLMAEDETYQAAIRDAQQHLDTVRQSLDQRLETWIAEQSASSNASEWSLLRIAEAKLDGDKAAQLQRIDDHTVQYSGNTTKAVTYRVTLDAAGTAITGLLLEALPDSDFGKPRQLAPSVNGNFVLTSWQVLLNNQPVLTNGITASFQQTNYPAAAAIDDDPRSGWAVFGNGVKPETVHAVLSFVQPLTLSDNDSLELRMEFNSGFANHSIGKFRLHASANDKPQLPAASAIDANVLAALHRPAAERSEAELQTLRKHYESIDQPLKQARAALDAALNRVPQATVMVMRERPGDPLPSYLLQRGQYDQPDKSQPLPRGIPVALLPPNAPQPANRLELAQWLVSRDNPLTARVIVNRIWQEHFGVGLVKTAEDFGLQGEMPSHPELLDWLAVEFIESGWDVKAMHRRIVTSQTYRQSSKSNPQLQAADPENRLLARGPRYRADGFVIRDIALQACGLLNETAGGPPVKPYQPQGLWAVVASSAGTRYQPSRGDDLYRKSMYTYWKRAVNPPRQTIFDAAGREICNVRVRRTNTPLQALVLMNDPTFVESARQLSALGLQQEAASDDQRLTEIYSRAVAHPIDQDTLAILNDNLQFFREHFQQHPDDAEKLLSVGASPRNADLNVVEHAAWTATAHLILNLDEFVTIE